MSDKGHLIFNIRPHHALGLDTELILLCPPPNFTHIPTSLQSGDGRRLGEVRWTLLIMRKLSKINSFSNVKCQQKLATLIKANYTIEGIRKRRKKIMKNKTEHAAQS